MATSYTAKDILVLEGLEPVRRRPGMYIGGIDKSGLHHLLRELVHNSVDEAMNRLDEKIFPDVRFDAKVIAERLEAKAYLHRGLAVEFVDETAGTKVAWRYEDGLKAFLLKIVAEQGRQALGGEVYTIQKEQDGIELE